MAALASSLSQSLQISLALQHSDVWTHHEHGKETTVRRRGRKKPNYSAGRRTEHDLTCGVRFWLAAASYGPEIITNFEAVYGILSLQYLGVPVYLVSVSGIVCGLVSMFLIPVMGSFADKGANPKRRKTLVLLFGLIMFTVGLCTLAIACGLKAKALKSEVKSSNSPHENNELNYIDIHNATEQRQQQKEGGYPTSTSCIQLNTSSFDSSVPANVQPLTMTGILGIVAYAIMDIGFDNSMTQIRTFLVDNVPRHQKSHILASATLVAAVGAVLIAFMGTFDLPSYLGPALHMDGIAATLIVICIGLLTSIILTYIATFTAGCFVNRRSGRHNEMEDEQQCLVVSDEESNEPNKKAKISSEVSIADQTLSNHGDSSSFQLSKSMTKQTNGKITYRTYSRATSAHMAQARKNTFLSQWAFVLDKRLLLVLTASFFAFASMLVMSVYISNTLTIEVLKGDPQALPGTDGKLRYEEGLRVASRGLLMANLSYLATGLVINKLFDFFGPKLMFLLTTASMTGACTLFCTVQSVETFYLLMIVYGPFRCALYTATYLLATTYTQSKNKNASVMADGNQTNLAKVMSLLGFLLTVSYLLLSGLMGPLMDATNSAWPPAYYLIGCSTISLLPLSILMFL